MQTKLPETQGSSLWDMRQMAMEHQAIDMSVGVTEFSLPARLGELASSVIRNQYNNYAPVAGCMSLREQVAARYFNRYGKRYSPVTEVTISAGPIQAISTAITAVVNEGDEVIIFEPSYLTYGPAVRLNGGTPVHVPLKEPGFRVEWEDLRKMITTRTRLIIINTPHNPTGIVFSREDMLQLQRLTAGTGIYIISDETYECLSYDQDKHQSAGQFEGLASRSFIVSSPGPVYHINGWGLAWCLAPEAMTAEFRKIQEYQIVNVAYPLQQALAEYMEGEDSRDEINEFYQGKRNYFNRLLKGSPYILHPTQGSYFQLVSFSAISQVPDTEFALRLLREGGVAAAPLSLFMHKKKSTPYLRFCFAKKNETLEEVARRMIDFAAKAAF
ncbi:MAG TPA: aminotransferase class I/II-fold pyridoxal phosphate-dependent enzyme [Prolixibacteraceae bacterium]|mgnify:FL=1|jgi:methionine aminotransferase|nr:aminotransferase class I/II-fold pyridoxal phosphate-dependent enzyme [Prolixibacteraceae bacterium]HRV88006.1 aminotransferase class I/II-fold pyridoxal phosphate-dependent enzyme [Prolixibacteraceae bacterium]